MSIADRELTCFFSGRPIHKGEEYIQIVEESEDGKVIDYIDVHPKAQFLINALNMYGEGMDNDDFCAQDYRDAIDNAFASISMSYKEYESIINSNNPFTKEDYLFMFYSQFRTPADAILDFMGKERIGMKEMPHLLGITSEEFIELLSDNVPIDDDLALRLELVTGEPSFLWVARQENLYEIQAETFASNDVCPNCGSGEVVVEEKWDEEHGAYVVGITVSCANCGKVKYDDWYYDVYVENWIDLYEEMYKDKE